MITINLIDGWTVKASYTDPSSAIDPLLLTPIDKKTIIMGDFNAKDPLWYDTSPLDNGCSIARGKVLRAWARKSFAVERGPRLPTRYRQGEKRSKVDLIWTRRDSEPLTIGDYSPLSHSDHMCLHARLRLIKPPLNMASPRPDYRRTPREEILKFFKNQPPPLSPDTLNNTLSESLKLIPR